MLGVEEPLDVAALRDQIPALRTCTHLNAGGIGPGPLIRKHALPANFPQRSILPTRFDEQ